MPLLALILQSIVTLPKYSFGKDYEAFIVINSQLLYFLLVMANQDFHISWYSQPNI